MKTIDDIATRLRGEFLEMPGLRLKPEQVQRLYGIERSTCDRVLNSLVDAKFLCVTSYGHYARLTDGEMFQPRAGNAGRDHQRTR